MREITIQKPSSASLVAQLIALYETLKNTPADEQVAFNLSSLTWVCPLLVLPLNAYITTTGSKAILGEGTTDFKSYLNTIHFPQGVDSVTEFERAMQATKSYMPISILRKESGAGRDRLESMFSTMVYKLLDVSLEGVSNAIYYPISELVTNIFEHSKQNLGFIFAQYYPKKEYLDICIVDRGRGLKTTYKEDKNIELTDEQAIEEVMKGHSVKPNKERGYGVWTSKKMVCEGLGGNFILVSGSSALISSGKEDSLVKLIDFYWQGVIISYRIPKPHAPFDFSKYVE